MTSKQQANRERVSDQVMARSKQSPNTPQIVEKTACQKLHKILFKNTSSLNQEHITDYLLG